MKKRLFFGLLAVAVAVVAVDADAKSFKRGVSENGFGLREEFDALMPGVSWFYNWGNLPNANIADVPGEETIEFIPMCWNANYNADGIREYCKAHPETKYLLGFNEPNFKAQANMTPEVAAEKWPAVKALADELGLELVGPAVNYSPDGPENDPFTWYANFVKLVGTDAFDYIALHCYSGGTGGMQDMIDRFYALYGKKIWLTEFSMGGDGGINVGSPEAQISSMVQQLEYLEKSDKVFRYSWFIAKGTTTRSPYIGLIVPKNGYGERELTEVGKVYVYMTEFDETVYHGVDDVVPASEYISSSSLVLGSNADSFNPGELEITQFHSGAYADYQFDIPSTGEYTLTLRVSGQGYDAGRWDPKIAIYSVDENGEQLATLAEATQFALSGDDAVFGNVAFKLQLQAGKQRIRIADTNPFQPSGMHISSLSFKEGFGGVESVVANSGEFTCAVDGGILHVYGAAVALRGEVYDLNGRLVASGAFDGNMMPVDGLAGGMYILKLYTDGGMQALKFCK